MLFLTGLLNRSSLSFILVSLVRLISIVAIIFMLAIEIYLTVVNIKGAHHSSQSDDPAGSGSQIKQDLGSNARNGTNNILSTGSCGYIKETNVPTTFGGILFFVLGQIFNMFILVLCLLSELSFPPLPQLFQNFFPPLGQSFGVGILGSLQVYIACTLLSHHINLTSRASAWILFLVGIINVFLGLIFGRRIRSKRSLLDASTSYVKKTTHIDDVETGIKFAQKGAKKGKSVFKNLKPSMISQPKQTQEKPWGNLSPSTSNQAPIELSKPIIEFIQHRREAMEASPTHATHVVSLPSEPDRVHPSFKSSR